MGSNKSLRSAMTDKLSPSTVMLTAPGSLARPLRSPARMDFMPLRLDPTSVSSLRRPFATSLPMRRPPLTPVTTKPGPDSQNSGADKGVCNIALPERFNIAESTDSTSLHSVSSPSSTRLGLPSSLLVSQTRRSRTSRCTALVRIPRRRINHTKRHAEANHHLGHGRPTARLSSTRARATALADRIDPTSR